jgi:hypothetical protein
VELFLKALEVDKFAEPREIWRGKAYWIGLKLLVDYVDMKRLSREFLPSWWR